MPGKRLYDRESGIIETMADPEHLNILKQGADVWNRWREEEFVGRGPDLSGVELTRAELSGANFFKADLSGADLPGASLLQANLSGADLHGAKLSWADLHWVDLSEANLRGVDLRVVNLSGANLSKADLTDVVLRATVFGDTNLSGTKGLESCTHHGPSTVDHRTLAKSSKLPLKFLRGVGLPDTFIDYLPSLLGDALQFYSCFISYSSKDQEFADRLHADLQNKGVRCWFAPEDLKIGARTRPAIDEAIRVRDKLLLILSEKSIASDWVEKEVETAFEEESRRKETVLFPIRLDSTVMDTNEAWAADIRRTRNIGDFRQWKDHDAYQKAFDRLLRDLKQEAEKGDSPQAGLD